MTNYTLKVDQANATMSTALVSIDYASLNVVNYAVKDLTKEIASSEHEVSVFLAEVSEGNAPGRTLLQITADGETVADILKTRLAKVRKGNFRGLPNESAPPEGGANEQRDENFEQTLTDMKADEEFKAQQAADFRTDHS